MTLVDEDRRRRALTDLGSTLLVEAAAGTGKTSLMAGRVAMLLASGCEPKHIAAITFTELAASELSLRIHAIVEALLAGEIPKVLRSALPNGLSVEQTSALAAAAHRLDELAASTIHGFCQEMIRSYAIDTDLDPGSRVIDGPGADAMFESVFSTWLIGRLSGEAAADDPIAVLSKDDPLKVVTTLKELADLKREHPTARTLPVQLDGRADIDFVQAVDDFARWVGGTPGERKTADIVGDLQTLASFYSDAFETRPTFEEALAARPPAARQRNEGEKLRFGAVPVQDGVERCRRRRNRRSAERRSGTAFFASSRSPTGLCLARSRSAWSRRSPTPLMRC